MTSATEAGMADELLSGERRAKARTRRYWLIVGALALAGFIPGFLLGFVEGDGLIGEGAVWPAWLSILLAVIFVASVSIGAIFLHRNMDELQRRQNERATAAAAGVYVLAYPVWFVLWMGDLVPEPSHWMLFALFYVTLAGYALWFKFR
jgi:hypothetical protein